MSTCRSSTGNCSSETCFSFEQKGWLEGAGPFALEQRRRRSHRIHAHVTHKRKRRVVVDRRVCHTSKAKPRHTCTCNGPCGTLHPPIKVTPSGIRCGRYARP